MNTKKGYLYWGSWLGLTVSLLLVATALIFQWAINAESLGGQDAGLALSLSFVNAMAMFVLLFLSPLLAAFGIAMLFFNRSAGLRLFIASATAAAPFLIRGFL